MTRRNPSLDVLRGLAVLMVIVSHYPYFAWMQVGWFGVDLFFVLSGFLISGLLFDELRETGDIRIGRFLLRRGFKIYPSFYVFLIITVIAWPGLRPHFWGNAAFIQNYLPKIQGWPERGWGHLWSLAVEEHFYFLLPITLLVMQRFGRLKAIPKTAVVLIVVCFLLRVLVGVLDSEHLRAAMYETQSRVDALFLGVGLSYLSRFDRARFDRMSRSWWLLTIPLFVIPASYMALVPLHAPAFSLGIATNEIGFAMLLIFALSRNLRFRPLEFIGRHSYSTYLWHAPVLVYFLRKPMSLAHFAENILCALALGIVMAKLVEFPSLRLRERFAADREKAPAEAGARGRMRVVLDAG